MNTSGLLNDFSESTLIDDLLLQQGPQTPDTPTDFEGTLKVSGMDDNGAKEQPQDTERTDVYTSI